MTLIELTQEQERLMVLHKNAQARHAKAVSRRDYESATAAFEEGSRVFALFQSLPNGRELPIYKDDIPNIAYEGVK